MVVSCLLTLVTTWLVACGEMHKARRKFLGNFNFLNLVVVYQSSGLLALSILPCSCFSSLASLSYGHGAKPWRAVTPHKKNVFTLVKLLGSNLIRGFILKQSKNCEKYTYRISFNSVLSWIIAPLNSVPFFEKDWYIKKDYYSNFCTFEIAI